MKKLLLIALLTAITVLSIMFMGCPPATSEGPNPPGPAATGADGNLLAATFTGSTISLVIDQNIAKEPPVAISGAAATVETFDGSSGVKVTANLDTEVRFAFKIDPPVVLTNFGTISFKIGGANLCDTGCYNMMVLYNETSGDDRVGSFYLGGSSASTWTTVSRDLTSGEQWGANFNQTREIYGIQFYADGITEIYIKDIAVTPYAPGVITCTDMALPTTAISGPFTTGYTWTQYSVDHPVTVTGTISTIVNTGTVTVVNGNEIQCAGAGSYIVYTFDTAQDLTLFTNLKLEYLCTSTNTYEAVIALRDSVPADVLANYYVGQWAPTTITDNTVWKTDGIFAVDGTATAIKTVVFGLNDSATMTATSYRNLRFQR